MQRDTMWWKLSEKGYYCVVPIAGIKNGQQVRRMDLGKEFGQKIVWCSSGGPNRLPCSQAMLFLHSLKEHLRVPVSPHCSTDIKHGSKLIATYYTLFTMSLCYLKPKLEHFQCCFWPMYMSVWYHMTEGFLPICTVCLFYLGKCTLKICA